MYLRLPGRLPGIRATAAVLLATALLAGCAGSDGEPDAQNSVSIVGPSGSGSPTAPEVATSAAAGSGVKTAPPFAPSVAAGREIVVSISGGQVQPPPGRIEVATGEAVRITVTSDIADELHVHGFGDPELALAPGVPGSLDIVADQPGQYDIETHESGLVLFQLLVR